MNGKEESYIWASRWRRVYYIDETKRKNEENPLESPLRRNTFLFPSNFIFSLPQTSSLTFPFEQAEDVSLADRSLYIPNNGTSARIRIHEIDTNLGHVARVSGTSQNLADFGKLDWLILFIFNKKRESVSEWICRWKKEDDIQVTGK